MQERTLGSLTSKGNMMSFKLRALGLGLVAALAMSAVLVMSASATDGGHFISDSVDGHTAISGADEATDQTEFTGGIADVKCSTATYAATTTTATATSLTVTPTYAGCTGGGGVAHVNMQGCTYTFTVRPSPETLHNTVHLVCPAVSGGPTIQVTSTGCVITVLPNQTPGQGVVYKTITTNLKHAITVGVTANNITAKYTGGFFRCGKAEGAHGFTEMHGSAEVVGKNTANEFVNITAT
jgi:hypothetical protein